MPAMSCNSGSNSSADCAMKMQHNTLEWQVAFGPPYTVDYTNLIQTVMKVSSADFTLMSRS